MTTQTAINYSEMIPTCKVTVRTTGAVYYGYRVDGVIVYVQFVQASAATKKSDGITSHAVTIGRNSATDCSCGHRQEKLKKYGKACKHMQDITADMKRKPASAIKDVTAAKPAAKVIPMAERGKFGTQGFSLLKRAI